MPERSAVFVAGAATLIGGALSRTLQDRGYRVCNSSVAEPTLTDPAAVDAFFAEHLPQQVVLAAGSSGGIEANRKYPADLMLDNLLVECNVISSAHRFGVDKLLYLASSCCYPRVCQQPMRVESLLAGRLEPTSEAYALAKLAGIKLCEAYRRQYNKKFVVGIPADIYGPGDSFDLEDAHVVPSLIRRMHEAKEQGAPSVTVWGSGTPRREFLFADDLASAGAFVLEHYDGDSVINMGAGEDLSIAELASTVRETVGYRGEVVFDRTRPDGMPLKALDSGELLSMGWRPSISITQGLQVTYKWYLENRPTGEGQ
jgi:GDP-L-fucose synthase